MTITCSKRIPNNPNSNSNNPKVRFSVLLESLVLKIWHSKRRISPITGARQASSNNKFKVQSRNLEVSKQTKSSYNKSMNKINNHRKLLQQMNSKDKCESISRNNLNQLKKGLHSRNESTGLLKMKFLNIQIVGQTEKTTKVKVNQKKLKKNQVRNRNYHQKRRALVQDKQRKSLDKWWAALLKKQQRLNKNRERARYHLGYWTLSRWLNNLAKKLMRWPNRNSNLERFTTISLADSILSLPSSTNKRTRSRIACTSIDSRTKQDILS